MRLPQPDTETWTVPWDELQQYDWVQAWRGSHQDPIHHAEGDVWIHVRWVLNELVKDPAFRALSPEDQEEVYTAVVFHDIAKPLTLTAEERPDGSIKYGNPGHSTKGAIMARQVMWEMGYPFALRERICAIVRYHIRPNFLLGQEDSLRALAEISLRCRPSLLAMHCRADNRGRISPNQAKAQENIDLFEMYADEHGCLDQPFAFASDHARYVYFNRPTGKVPYDAYDDTRSRVIVMSGLPGSGKDTWIRNNCPDLPMISLDAIRAEMGVAHGDKVGMGRAVQEAKLRAKRLLADGLPFVWNGTHLSKDMRGKTLALLRDYNARIKIVYVEVPPEVLFRQNRDREAVVPEAAIRKMQFRWTVPNLTEAHEVEYVVRT